jgi:hypothetical protein
LPPGGPGLPAARPGPDLAAAGYAEAEYVASGTALSFTADELPADGHLELREDETAVFATRVQVRRPVRPSRFSGTVVVEWLNVSSGMDAAPDWTYLADEIVRSGHAWVGVSAQFGGVEGGVATVAVGELGSPGLKGTDPERYATLSHPGDAFAYDLFSQVASGLAYGGPLAGLDVRRHLAVGESQSAFALTTYVNGVHPLAQVFDGFLVHSRGGATMPLGEPGAGIDLNAVVATVPTRFRSDLTHPVLVVETETDLVDRMAYGPARQPDQDRLRVWEVAGTAHADLFQIGAFEEFLGCPLPVNRGQQAYVVRAALRHLDAWAGGGRPAPSAEPLVLVGECFETDANGNVLGGVRTPVVDAPVEVLSGRTVPDASRICQLFGSTTPLAPGRLAELYDGPDTYLAAYELATDAAIEAGFVLAEDRAEILAEARPELVLTDPTHV